MVLTKDNQIEETMFLGLRVLSGVSMTKFQETFACPMKIVYGRELDRLMAQGMVEEKDDYIRLTEKGIALSNQVLAEFLL